MKNGEIKVRKKDLTVIREEDSDIYYMDDKSNYSIGQGSIDAERNHNKKSGHRVKKDKDAV